MIIRVGDRFGIVTVMETGRRIPLTSGQIRHGKRTGSKAVLISCACGIEKLVRPAHLAEGRYVSCGCLRAARFPVYNVTEKVIHGLSHHEHYNRWTSMMHRCYDASRGDYERYGGRGIRVATEWHNPSAFIAYLETVLGPRPDGHTMDRIDNDGDYRPGNIRWATMSTQRRNRRIA